MATAPRRTEIYMKRDTGYDTDDAMERMSAEQLQEQIEETERQVAELSESCRRKLGFGRSSVGHDGGHYEGDLSGDRDPTVDYVTRQRSGDRDHVLRDLDSGADLRVGWQLDSSTRSVRGSARDSERVSDNGAHFLGQQQRRSVRLEPGSARAAGLDRAAGQAVTEVGGANRRGRLAEDVCESGETGGSRGLHGSRSGCALGLQDRAVGFDRTAGHVASPGLFKRKSLRPPECR